MNTTGVISILEVEVNLEILNMDTQRRNLRKNQEHQQLRNQMEEDTVILGEENDYEKIRSIFFWKIKLFDLK